MDIQREIIEVFAILFLTLVVSISFLTMFRTCEILDKDNNQVVKINCAEVKVSVVKAFEK